MFKTLQKPAGFFFYLLGVLYLGAYILFFNEIQKDLAGWWMQVADLPFLLAAVVYAGTSLYGSVTHWERKSAVSAALITLPLIAIFSLFVVLNFWELMVQI